MDVVFLDANVLFSAAYRPNARLRTLWEIKDARLVTSVYAIEEVRRNLTTPLQRGDLETLIQTLEIVSAHIDLYHPIFATIALPEKDRPILLAAIQAHATHLLTGDARHFGPYYERELVGIRILPPAAYLRAVTERLRDDA